MLRAESALHGLRNDEPLDKIGKPAARRRRN
jgi:hypothetical protein